MKAVRRPVLLHGLTGSSGTWPHRVVDGLTDAGHAPVLVDLPGHGHHVGTCDPAQLSLDVALSDIHRAGEWPAGLVGYSMGGRLALHFALAHPSEVTRLVLESASPGLETEAERAARRAADEELAALLEREGIERFVDLWESLPLFASQARLEAETRARHRRLRLANRPRSLAAALRGLGPGRLPSLWERLSEVAMPTLLVAGALDPRFVEIAERMASAMPDARLTVIPDAGHAVHLERPGAWLEAVKAFL